MNKITRSKKNWVPFFLVVMLVATASCNKWLEKKPSQSLQVPNTLADLQALIDNQSGNASPAYIEMITDNFYLPFTSWQGGIEDERLNYTWDKNAKIATEVQVWRNPYTSIYQCNVVLDQLTKIRVSEPELPLYNSIKGTALFSRAFSFYQLAQVFCKPYSSSAASDPGIVLKLSPVLTEPYSRATIQQTYDQIITDLKTAVDLLPSVVAYSSRPNKAAAAGKLARVYLSMRQYTEAEHWANVSLGLDSTLLDYKDLVAHSLPTTFLSNPEVLFSAQTLCNLIEPSAHPIIDSNLYASYAANDLRKNVFFGNYPGDGKPYWKGCYTSSQNFYYVFTGIAVDEVYLIRAECRARAGRTNEALRDLNTLLRKRHDNTFIDIFYTDPTDALDAILTERRKELLFRGLRWTDLRRLNLENANITLKRVLEGTTYTLPPNDLRWVLQIPEDEIALSGITQNPR